MTDWLDMEAAPKDGTWIIGRNEDGREARIQSRSFHPKLPDLQQWFEGEDVQEGNWVKNTCFYPVEWRPA